MNNQIEIDSARFGQLLIAERALQAAQLTSDFDALDDLIHDDLRNFIGPDTGLHGKEEDLAAHREHLFTFVESNELSVDAQVVGETGITTALLALKVKIGDDTVDGTYRYIRTWVFEDERWQIIAGAVVAVPEEMRPE
jgi:ketosteroid isomerase-like protein